MASRNLQSKPRRCTHRILGWIVILTQLLLAVSTGIHPASAAPQSGGPVDPVELGAFLDGVFATQMKADHVAGAVVAVVKDGQVLYTHGYGYADLEKHKPVDPQKTLFRPGSISKLFVGTAVMQLVEQGKISLDADVNSYLDFAIPATYPQPITLRHLLTHTPGFEDSSKDTLTVNPDKIIPLDVFLKTHIPARVFSPGTVSAYSNYGAALAAYIVERVSGMPFSAYVEKNIFRPLGMTHSTFVQPLPDALAPDMARGYYYSNGAYQAGSFEIVQVYPAGSLSATADDMTRFMIAHLQNGRYENAQILSEATARQMHTPLFRPDPRLNGMAYAFFEKEVNGQKVIWHGGNTILFHSGLYLLPDQNLGIFISTNAQGGSKTSEAVFQGFMDRYYPVPPRAAAPLPADFTARAAQYSGEYYLSRSNFTTYEKLLRVFSPMTIRAGKEGELLVSMGAGSAIRYTEVEPGRLVAEEGPMPILVLSTDPSGQVSLLTSMPWKLIKSPWYATSTVHLLIFVGGLLLFLGTLVAWLSAWLKTAFSGLFRRRARLGPSGQPGPPRQSLSQPLSARLGRTVAGLFMLIFIVFLVGLVAVTLDLEPALGIPRFAVEATPATRILFYLVPIMGVLGVLTVPFVFLAWRNSYWTARGRLWYTLLSAWFLVGLWAMVYWNLLL
jgi:CubicO group peptidase (beta-lactamase class C family)